MKIIAEYLECNLESDEPGEDVMYEQECSTAAEAASFINGHRYNLTPDGWSIELESISFEVDGKKFYLADICDDIGDEEMFDACDGGYLREMDIDAENMQRYMDEVTRQAGEQA